MSTTLPFRTAGLRWSLAALPILLSIATPAAASVDAWSSAALRVASPEDVGMSSARLAAVDSMILAGIRSGITPGAALAIGRHGSIVRLRGYGSIDWARGAAAVSDSTVYDIASLTKVVGTTLATMLMVERGTVRLDAPVVQYYPFWSGEGAKRQVTVRHLLTHTAGLPAGLSLGSVQGGRDGRLARAASARLVAAPGARMIYSDVSMIVLGALLEQASGRKLDALFDEEIFAPLGLRETLFNPRAPGPRRIALDRIAPTELRPSGRARHLQGEVHDPAAFALDNITGNAGLFSSARDLAVVAQLLLDRAKGRGEGLVNPMTVGEFIRSWQGGRGLGWDVPWSAASGAGEYFSRQAFGHTGYTGTSIWIDPDRDIFVVLLTNRVNPSASNTRHVPLRRAIHDAINLSITDQPIAPLRIGQDIASRF